jgi:hypothetical protein
VTGHPVQVSLTVLDDGASELDVEHGHDEGSFGSFDVVGGRWSVSVRMIGGGGSGPTPLGLAGRPTSVGGGDIASHVLPPIVGQGAQEPRVLVHGVSFQGQG